MRVSFAAMVIGMSLASTGTYAAPTDAERIAIYGQFMTAAKYCGLHETPKFATFRTQVNAIGIAEEDFLMHYHEGGERFVNAYKANPGTACGPYTAEGWMVSIYPPVTAPATLAPQSASAKPVTDASRATANVASSDSIWGTILGVCLFAYVVATGVIMYPRVRPPLSHWYNSQNWFISGTGPVDILLRQIGFKITFEAFILFIACLVGALGGWLVIFMKKSEV